MAMVTAATPSLIDGLTILTELNNLCADQDPDKLSDALRSAFTKRELYKMYLSFLVEDQERVKVLLEVFDKVCTENTCHPGVILIITSRHRLSQPRKVIHRYSRSFASSVAARDCYPLHT
jgi:hypothetical protein